MIKDKVSGTPAKAQIQKEIKTFEPPILEESQKLALSKYCKKVDKRFLAYGWGRSKCLDYDWVYELESVKKDPLIWTTFGSRYDDKGEKQEVTLIMCGVHGDEITPIKFCFDIVEYLRNLNETKHGKADLEKRFVVVAPIVNPDSFFKRRPTRTNANGVDINRNFPTKDFKKNALKLWKNRYRRDSRRYPGKKAQSEPEVTLQVNFIKEFRPKKIISVHAPLTMLDYDGPADAVTGGEVGTRANQLLIQMSEKARNYRIKNYPFFPGSLGNYAGNERDIPTFTLELPSSDNRRSAIYWKRFKHSIHSAIMHDLKPDLDVAMDESSSEAHTHEHDQTASEKTLNN
tara:strand:+ start:49621 stop:50652 length:1032 start_codon:yes stop_codon:yes gene_type:complete